MKDASLFILLPNGNEICDMSLDKESLDTMMAPLMQVKAYALTHDISLRIFFDIENITTFVRDVKEIIDNGAYFDKPSSILTLV